MNGKIGWKADIKFIWAGRFELAPGSWKEWVVHNIPNPTSVAPQVGGRHR